MRALESFIPGYRDLFERFVLAQEDFAREQALFEATEAGKAMLAHDPAVDQILEVHRQAQQDLADRWCRAAPDSPEALGRDRLARGEAMPLMLALMLPHDLAQQVRHEQRWCLEHAKLAALFEQTDELIQILDGQGRIELLNPAFERVTGWSSQGTAGTLAHLWADCEPGLTTRRVRSMQATRDGRRFLAEWSVSPILGQDEQVLNHVCIGRDITREQQMLDSLRENDKLRATATLTAGIAHDFNSLLGSIIGLAELCQLAAEPGTRLAVNLERIRQAGDRAAALVRQMQEFSRQAPGQTERVSGRELLERCRTLLQAALPAGMPLEIVIDADGVVSVDPVRMEQVLLNVVRNAAEAMRQRPDGSVRIVVDALQPGLSLTERGRAIAPAPLLRLRVIDTGAGIEPQLLPRIFDPFFTTKAVGEGPGLGLSSAHGIVVAHGGLIDVESQPGAGTTVSIGLPLQPA